MDFLEVEQLLVKYKELIYFIAFLCIFLKIGVPMLSFLPGETLLVMLGFLSHQEVIDLHLCIFIVSVASVLGGMFNYMLGRYFGQKMIKWEYGSRMVFSPVVMQRAENFYVKYGDVVIVFSRFIPVVRIFTIFVAGMYKMNYFIFWVYNALGGVLWVLCYILLGYFFGNVLI